MLRIGCSLVFPDGARLPLVLRHHTRDRALTYLHTTPSGNREYSRFEADRSIKLEVPVSFGERLLPSMTIKIKTSAGYTTKFKK